MALFNYASKELTLKVVYYGPGLCGKTTNLQHLHANMNPEKRTKLLSLSTESDRTLFFDFMPVALGKIKDFDIKFQLYTVPGQVRYNATRKLVLKGADAIVFVADSQSAMKEANVESLQNMKENLTANNIDPDDIPVVLQYNKRDLDNILTVEELDDDLNSSRDRIIEAAAINGMGVEETFKIVTQRLLKHISNKHNVRIEAPEEGEQETSRKHLEKAHVAEHATADDSVVSISVKDKGTEVLQHENATFSESDIEEDLLKTSIPDAEEEEDSMAWPSPTDDPIPKISAEKLSSTESVTESSDFFDELPSAKDLYDELGEETKVQDSVGEVSEAVAMEELVMEAAGHERTQELLLQILEELRESRKQRESILTALRNLGNIDKP